MHYWQGLQQQEARCSAIALLPIADTAQTNTHTHRHPPTHKATAEPTIYINIYVYVYGISPAVARAARGGGDGAPSMLRTPIGIAASSHPSLEALMLHRRDDC